MVSLFLFFFLTLVPLLFLTICFCNYTAFTPFTGGIAYPLVFLVLLLFFSFILFPYFSTTIRISLANAYITSPVILLFTAFLLSSFFLANNTLAKPPIKDLTYTSLSLRFKPGRPSYYSHKAFFRYVAFVNCFPIFSFNHSATLSPNQLPATHYMLFSNADALRFWASCIPVYSSDLHTAATDPFTSRSSFNISSVNSVLAANTNIFPASLPSSYSFFTSANNKYMSYFSNDVPGTTFVLPNLTGNFSDIAIRSNNSYFTRFSPQFNYFSLINRMNYSNSCLLKPSFALGDGALAYTNAESLNSLTGI